jgi:hypothetical protein
MMNRALPRSGRLCECSVVFGYPRFGEREKGFGLPDNLSDLGLSRDAGHVVINLVPLASAGFEKRRVGSGRSPHREFESSKRILVVADTERSVSGAVENHRCSLECSIVGRRKATIVRQLGNVGVVEVTLDDGAQAVDLDFRRLVRLYLPRVL